MKRIIILFVLVIFSDTVYSQEHTGGIPKKNKIADSLMIIVKLDSIKEPLPLYFHYDSLTNCTLTKDSIRQIELLIYQVLSTDTLYSNTMLYKKFQEYTRNYVFSVSKGHTYLMIFYLDLYEVPYLKKCQCSDIFIFNNSNCNGVSIFTVVVDDQSRFKPLIFMN